MEIYKNYDLTKLNTFGICARAKFFVEINSERDLSELFLSSEFKNNKKLFLGGGSNILFTKDFDGLVVLNKLKGIEIIKEDSEYVFIKAMSGEIWDDLVIFVAGRGYWGIENLALIPGTVGAAPVQNIGAYGAELKDILENVETREIENLQKKTFQKEECAFGYRDSVFKGKLKDKYFICSITLKLNKKEKKNLSYKILSDYIKKNKIEITGPETISDAVRQIRRSKLPDPKVIANAGSFFKNVFVNEEKLKELLQKYPNMPYFTDDKDGSLDSVFVKIPAGWLIEQCEWKGKRAGNVGVHDKQALVLVNYGGAKGEEVKNLAENIRVSVLGKFGLELVSEVNLI